jgi:hypothetical protein
VCCPNFNYWHPCFIVSSRFLLAHASEWKINQVLHHMRCYCFVASDGVGLASRAFIFICFQVLDTGSIEPFLTGSKLKGESTVGKKEEYA